MDASRSRDEFRIDGKALQAAYLKIQKKIHPDTMTLPSSVRSQQGPAVVRSDFLGCEECVVMLRQVGNRVSSQEEAGRAEGHQATVASALKILSDDASRAEHLLILRGEIPKALVSEGDFAQSRKPRAVRVNPFEIAVAALLLRTTASETKRCSARLWR